MTHSCSAAFNQNCSAGFSPTGAALLTRRLAAFALCGIVVFSWAGPGVPSAADATARMEQLAGKIERAEALQPDTVRRLETVMHRPQYDCARVRCGADLRARNQAARARLETAIARTYRREIAAAGQPRD